MSCHLLSFPNSTRELSVTDGTWLAMCFTVTVSIVLLGEIPSFNHTSSTLTYRSCLNIDILTNFEMSRAKTIPNWKEVLW